MKIVTNNKPRKILNWWELSKHQLHIVKEEYSLSDPEEYESELCDVQFIFYKGHPYLLSDFTRVNNNIWCNMSPNDPIVKGGWHGYTPESYSHGVLIKIMPDNDNCIIGQFFC